MSPLGLLLVVGLVFEMLITLANSWISESQETLTRHRRYLTYPDADPARVQFILGVGLPVDLEDQSVTLGYVIKIQYHIPLNSSDYTSPMYGSAVDVRSNRDRRDGQHEDITISRQDEGQTQYNPARGDDENIINKNDPVDRHVFDEERGGRRRNHASGAEDKYKEDNLFNIIYTEGGKTSVREKDKPHDNYVMEIEEVETRARARAKTTRWDIYRVLEHMAAQNGLSGRACMLRTICEAAETPFTYKNGLLGELFHIIFTPSSSSDRLSHHSDNEYLAAEVLGSDQESNCEYLFPECSQSVLEMFSQVGFESLFG